MEGSGPGAFPTEADVDAVLAEFGGDGREAIRALHYLAALAADYDASVSHGFVRGEVPRVRSQRSPLMASVTYYAVLPFVRDRHGNLCPDEAVECSSPAAATARARALVATKVGAVAFSRTGDPDTREWADAVVLAREGETPADLEIASG